MRWLWIVVFLAGCGSSAVSPSPQPSPSPVPSPAPPPAKATITATLTATVSGAPAGTFTADVDRLPALVSVSAAGYLTRQAYIGSATPTVDLIALAAPFDLSFYRQLVRNGYEAPGSLEPITVLTVSPSIYLQTTGLSGNNVAAMEAAARAVIPAGIGAMTNPSHRASCFGAKIRPAWISISSRFSPSSDWATGHTVRVCASGVA